MSYRRVYRYEDQNRGLLQFFSLQMRNPMVLTSLGIVAFVVFTSDTSKILKLFKTERDIRYNGRLPNSLLTVNYPYTLMRDVVQEQPVDESDVPFFWHPHQRDSRIIEKVLETCYGMEVIKLETLDAIKNAKEVDLPAREPGKFVITSPYLREVAELFSPKHLGRASCYFRHPLDYDPFPNLPKYKLDDNWLARYLLNDGTTVLDLSQLGFAKQIIREVCVAAPMDKIEATIKRYADYMGWKLKGSEDCIEEAVEEEFVNGKKLDHDSEEWISFYSKNRYDCQLYEYSQQTWRAQIQTIVSYDVQLKRKAKKEED